MLPRPLTTASFATTEPCFIPRRAYAPSRLATRAHALPSRARLQTQIPAESAIPSARHVLALCSIIAARSVTAFRISPLLANHPNPEIMGVPARYSCLSNVTKLKDWRKRPRRCNSVTSTTRTRAGPKWPLGCGARRCPTEDTKQAGTRLGVLQSAVSADAPPDDMGIAGPFLSTECEGCLSNRSPGHLEDARMALHTFNADTR